MARLIDADALELDTEWDEYQDGFTSYSQLQIDTAPTIDIVFCKDCKYRGGWKCWMRNNIARRFPQDDDFCSYGERKERVDDLYASNADKS